jgi:hypothetical protein
MLGNIVHAYYARAPWLGTALRRAAGPIVGLLLVAYSAASYHLVLGVPGLPYTGAFARFMGWQQATAELQAVQARLQQATGLAPVVVGLDKYNTASQIGFYGAAPFVAPGQAAAQATSLETFNGNALMFTYWNPPASRRAARSWWHASVRIWPPTNSPRTSRRWTRPSTRWRWATRRPAATSGASIPTTTALATASNHNRCSHSTGVPTWAC